MSDEDTGIAVSNVECEECGEEFSVNSNPTQREYGEMNAECPHCGAVGDHQIVGDNNDDDFDDDDGDGEASDE